MTQNDATVQDKGAKPQSHPTGDPPGAKPGANWGEYAAEFVGTLLLVLIGLSAVVFDFGNGTPMDHWIPGKSPRLLVTGLLFAGTGSLIAVSPIGRRSGAHINPAVSLGFYVHGKMHLRDFVGYVVAQFGGAIGGALLLQTAWRAHAASIKDGMTLPGDPPYTVAQAFAAEAALTGLMVLLIFLFVSSKRLMRWTPLMNWLVIATMVWREAPISGTSLNPARSIGPALVYGLWRDQWLYCIAPPLGALAAVGVYRLLTMGKIDTLTGKLFHRIHDTSIFKNVAAPSRPHPASVQAVDTSAPSATRL